MQLYVIDWSFQDAEDQLFATNQFCEYFRKGKINTFIEGFELIFIAHTPQNGSGTIICRSQNARTIYDLINMWRDSYSISFNIKPALTNEELLDINSSQDFWNEE